MAEFIYGECMHCGQRIQLPKPVEYQSTADDFAAEQCDCPDAVLCRKVKRGQARVDQLFGPDAETRGFKPVAEDETIQTLYELVMHVAEHRILNVTLLLNGYGRAKIGMTGKGKLKVERQEVHAYQLEE